jgi:MraZ protein
MFFGKYTQVLNEKSGLTLPANYRDAMGKSAYIIQGFDRNLLLIPLYTFESFYVQIKVTSISDPLARLLNRLFLGSAVMVNINDSGQLDLPVTLCEYARLEEEVNIIGQGEYLEIWSPIQWQKQEDILNDHDSNCHRFEKFHVSI